VNGLINRVAKTAYSGLLMTQLDALSDLTNLLYINFREDVILVRGRLSQHNMLQPHQMMEDNSVLTCAIVVSIS